MSTLFETLIEKEKEEMAHEEETLTTTGASVQPNGAFPPYKFTRPAKSPMSAKTAAEIYEAWIKLRPNSRSDNSTINKIASARGVLPGSVRPYLRRLNLIPALPTGGAAHKTRKPRRNRRFVKIDALVQDKSKRLRGTLTRDKSTNQLRGYLAAQNFFSPDDILLAILRNLAKLSSTELAIVRLWLDRKDEKA